MNFSKTQMSIITASEPRIICLSSAASGKAIPNSTTIPTSTGMRRVDEIKEGDYLFDRDGKPTKVLGVYPQGKKKVFEITFHDGRKARCCDEHIWLVKQYSQDYELIKGYTEMTLKDIMKYSEKALSNPNIRRFYNNLFFIPCAAPLKIKANENTKNISIKEAVDDLINNFDDKLLFYPPKIKEQMIEELAKRINSTPKSAGYIFSFGEKEKFTKDTVDNIKLFLNSCGYTYDIIREFEMEYYYRADFYVFAYGYQKGFSINIAQIEELDYEEEMTCFYVDNEEHLFLTENFLVTHNTRVLTERIRNLVEVKNVKPEDIVAITFTNAAALEMRQRLGSISDNMFIGTIHSYANKICSMNGVDTISDINKQEFDKILEKVMKIPKAKYPKVQHLLVDECQDMTLLVFDFVNKIPSENIFLVGDTRQTIYTFNGSSDSYMRAIYNSHDFKSYNLAENYRNPPNIIDYAEEFLSSNKFTEIGPKSIPVKKREGIIEKRTFSEVIDYIAQDKNWGSWFVLTRTNAELDKAVEILADNDIPCFAFRKHELDLDGVQDALLRNCVKVMTIHTSKGLQAKNVAVIGARTYNVDERRISYVAATRAESALFWCPTVVKKGYGKSKSSKKPKNLTFFTDGGNDIIQF